VSIKLPAEVGDLRLTNGKTYRSVVVLSQTSSALSVKHAGGLTRIEKQHLPPEVLARFPLNAELAAQEQQAQETADRRRNKELQLAEQRKSAERARNAANTSSKAAGPAGYQQSAVTPPSAAQTPANFLENPQEQIARSPHGLFLVRWMHSYGDVNLTVRNATTSSYKFDYRQIQGLGLDNGEVLNPVDVKFKATEVANYWLDGGKEQTFLLVFPGQPKFAAMSWTGTEEWRLAGYPFSTIATSKTTAIQQTREVAAATKAAQKASMAKSEAAYTKAEADKRLINK
jgi:hypothetical protein